MNFEVFTNLISPIILVACLMIGYVLKNLYPSDKVNRFIPLIVGILGIIFNSWALQDFNFNIAMAGMASGLASTGAYEAFKNLIEKK